MKEIPDLNSNEDSDLNLNYDLLKSYKNTRNFAWGVALLFIFLFVSQFIYYQNKPAQVIGVDEDGNYVGTVVFDEVKIRDDAVVQPDVTSVIQRCISNSKETIWDDAAICVGHFDDELSESWLTSWENDGSLIAVENSGCVRSEYEFSDVQGWRRNGNRFEGIWSGTVSCNDNPDSDPIPDDYFKIKVLGKIVPRKEGRKFGVVISEYDDEIE